MSIRLKTSLSFGILLVLFAGILVYQTIFMRSQNESIHKVNEVTLESMLIAEDLNNVYSNLVSMAIQMQAGLVTQEATQTDSERLVGEFYQLLDRYVEINPTSTEQAELVRKNFSDTLAIMSGSMQGDIDAIGAQLNESVLSFKASNVQAMKAELTETVDSSNALTQNVLIMQGVILIVGIGIALWFSSNLVRPIRGLIHASAVISEGDLSKPLAIKAKGEVGKLADIFEKMRANLSAFIQASQKTAEHVAASSKQLKLQTEQSSSDFQRMAEAVKLISDGAEQQMTSTEETARAMDEIMHGVQRVSESTSEVSEISQTTEDEAKQGNELLMSAVKQMDTIRNVVQQFTGTVERLNQRSEDITQIIETIHGISAQTNMLALNASIEASRAGETGRGFMVVAQEIRKLSEQTKASSDHISEIIEQIQADTKEVVNKLEEGTQEVKRGQETIHHANEAFTNITESTGTVAVQIQEVSAAAQQMTASAQEINAALNGLAHIARQTNTKSDSMVAASDNQMLMLQEFSMATDALSQSAEQLQSLISKFKV